MSALGRLVRGLSALFWGIPIALVVCLHAARNVWLQPIHMIPPLLATGLLVYGLSSMFPFQRQERVWQRALDRARAFALINCGLSPFLYFWNRLPSNYYFLAAVQAMALSGLFFLLALNPVLCRLAAMLPDETLRLEIKLFTTVNRFLLLVTLLLLFAFLALSRIQHLPRTLVDMLYLGAQFGWWGILALILLPIAITMALLWKTKEVILSGVFGPGAAAN